MKQTEIEIIVPETLNDITLNQYREFIKIEGEVKESDVLRIFYGLSNEHINKLRVTDVTMLSNKIVEILKEKPKQNEMIFKMGGVQYGFIPNLEEITYGENKDITSYLGNWEYMDRYMAVAFRPITKIKGGLYEIQKYEGSNKLKDVMGDAPLGIVLSSMVFFWTLINELLKDTLHYSTQMKKQKKTKDSSLTNEQYLIESGEVTKKYTNSLKEILEDLTRLLPYHYNNV